MRHAAYKLKIMNLKRILLNGEILRIGSSDFLKLVELDRLIDQTFEKLFGVDFSWENFQKICNPISSWFKNSSIALKLQTYTAKNSNFIFYYIYKGFDFRMGRGGGAGRGGGPMHGGMPHVPNHHFQNQNYGQPQQQSGWRFSWMNIIPIYTLCIVGYAIYIYFKGKQIGYDWDSGLMFFLVKNKTPEEREKRRGGIQKTELGELKERLAKTEAALTKLMEATNMISEKMNPDGKSK